MSQRSALEATVEGHDVPAAVLELALGLADIVDGEPSNAAMWREYRAAIGAVMEVVSGSDDDEAAAFREEIATPIVLAQVRDRKNA